MIWGCIKAIVAFLVCFIGGIGLVLVGIVLINSCMPAENVAEPIYFPLD